MFNWETIKQRGREGKERKRGGEGIGGDGRKEGAGREQTLPA